MITIPLRSDTGHPLYLQIYEYIKKEILAGNLSHPGRLPSARSLAANLQVSRSTVDNAYEQLVAEGYVEAEEKRGYFINPITHAHRFEISGKPLPKAGPASQDPCRIRYDFDPDAVDTVHFPYSVWKSIGRNHLDDPEIFTSGSHFGDYGLRQAVSEYLHGSRGVNCTPDNIVVGAGLDHLLQMLCVLFQRKAVIAMEDPGYLSARQVLVSSGCTVLNIPLSQGAFDVGALKHCPADICYVTPSHQFPMGSILTISRRQALLDWAVEKPGRYIIEDDHDSEFRYKGKPIPALQSLDHGQRVIYIGTFSKAISPSIRTGYMVLPDPLMTLYRKRCGGYACPVSRFGQAVLTDFIRGGYFEKHLNRMRKIYKGRHDYMLEQLSSVFPDTLLDISADNAGLYMILHYHGPLTDCEIQERAAENRIRIRSLKGYYAALPADYRPAFLLGFANPDTHQIRDGVALLAEKVLLRE